MAKNTMAIGIAGSIIAGAAVTAALLSPLSPARAQNLFSPAAYVNDAVVTHYELQQRIRFLRLLNRLGNLREAAMDGLIDDRLRTQAAEELGINISEEQIRQGMEEFVSGTGGESAELFIEEIEGAGVDLQTFRDFVEASLLWREAARSRFGPRAQVTESEIDRAIALASNRAGARVLLSEIIIPAPEGREAEALQLAGEMSRISSDSEFASAARTYSAAASRNRGGQLDWLALGGLPSELRASILTLSPGQVSEPVELPGAVAVFRLHGIEETAAPDSETLSVEYAAYRISGPSARSQAQEIRDGVDTCDDLHGAALGQPSDVLERQTLSLADVPEDIAIELSGLDENESSAALTHRSEGEALIFLMLCERVTAQAEDVSRDEIRLQLLNRRLESHAVNYLAELRADATIIFP